MEKTVITFGLLLGLLIFGIFILIKPSFVFQSHENQNAVDNQPSVEGLVPREVIISGSALIIIGLVGLSVLGFRIYAQLFIESNSKK